MIDWLDLAKTLLMLGMMTVFVKGISSRDNRWLYVNYVFAFFEIIFLNTFVAYASIFGLLLIQNAFLFKEDSYWKEGVVTFIGDTDPYRTNGNAYKIQMRYGIRYLIVQMKNGKAYYYEDSEQFYNDWNLEPGAFPKLEKLLKMRV